MLLVERLRVYIHVAYAHPVCAAGQIVLGASLAVSPWYGPFACALMRISGQCPTALVVVVQNRRDHLAELSLKYRIRKSLHMKFSKLLTVVFLDHSC